MEGNYYPLTPISNEDGLGESLSGFLCRVAKLHGISTNALLSHLDKIAHTRIPQTYTLLNSRTFNGCGEVSKRIQAAMRRIYPDLDLRPYTLNDVGKAFCRKGIGLLNWDRHWCPECFIDQRSGQGMVFERLCWQIASTKICPVHNTPLQSRCPECNKIQHRMPPSGHLDICTKCKAWLGSRPGGEIPMDEHERSYEVWVASQIPCIISSQFSGGNLITGTEVSATLHTLCEQHDCSASTISKISDKPISNIREWMKGIKKPTMANWFRVCASLNLEVENTIFSPKQASIQLNLDFSPPTLPATQKRTSIKRYSVEKIRSALQYQLSLKRPLVKSIVELGKQIETPPQAIFYHCKLEAKNLSNRIATIRKRDSKMFREHLERSGTKLIVRRWQAGLSTTRKEFVDVLVKKEACSQHKAKDAFPVCSRRAKRIINRLDS